MQFWFRNDDDGTNVGKKSQEYHNMFTKAVGAQKLPKKDNMCIAHIKDYKNDMTYYSNINISLYVI